MFYIVALLCTHSNARALVAHLQLAPRSLPGIINIAAILIKWQSRIASHSRGHSAHKSPASMLHIVLNQRYESCSTSSEWDAVEWEDSRVSCRTTGVCWSFCDTNLNMSLCVAAKKKDTIRSCCVLVSIKFSHGIFNQWGWFFFFFFVAGDWKWVGANDKWKRSAPFISPASGVKWRLAATIRAASAGWY